MSWQENIRLYWTDHLGQTLFDKSNIQAPGFEFCDNTHHAEYYRFFGAAHTFLWLG